MNGHDSFEDRLRDALRSGDPARDRMDVDAFLSDVHHGARSRRRRRTIEIAAAAAVVLVGGGAAVGSLGFRSDDQAPIADNTTAPTTTQTSTFSSEKVVHYTSDNTSVLSLTSTGTDHQWALTATVSDQCAPACFSVFTHSSDTGVWGTPALLPDSDAGPVSQVRYVGDGSSGYDGWAFGPALLSVHGIGGTHPGLWHTVDVGGAVTSLEAHGTTVYAIVDNAGSWTLKVAPVHSDSFTTVDTGPQLGTASNLVATSGVVAFLDKSGDATEVVSSPADPSSGEPTGEWTRSQPCSSGSEPVSLSSASDTLWALCSDGGVDTIALRSSGSDWQPVHELRFGLGSLLTARSADSAVLHLVDNTALELVTADGAGPLTTGSPGFSDPTMLGFTNSDLGFAIAQGVLWRSNDGGATWTQDQVISAAD